MFDSTALEVAIGLALVFLLLSLFCTTINESLAAIFGWRARTLERGIQSLFNGGQIKAVNSQSGELLRNLADVVYNHGLVQSLYKSKAGQDFVPASQIASRDLPSYIPSRVFASALYDILFNGPDQPLRDPSPAGRLRSMVDAVNQLPDSKAKEALIPLVKQAQGDADATRRAFELWFNDGMDRVSGWYKRRTQLVLFALGLSFAVLLNIDTISVSQALWASPASRAFAIKAAESYVTPAATPTAAGATAGANGPYASRVNLTASEKLTALGQLALPLGWNNGPYPWPRNADGHQDSGGALAFKTVSTLLGWILTGFAVTLGAPFWFDLLNQFMVIRSTVKPTEKSGTEGSKDPSPA
jgi:hypothetical protein